MDKIRIEGGRRLSGSIEISGSKNASLPLMAAALLADSPSRLERIPKLRDIDAMEGMVEHLGARFVRTDGAIEIDPRGLCDTEAPYDLVRKMRASIYVLGPLLARFGHARVSLPGGCAIGPRPIDLHLRGLAALGADIAIRHGYVEATAPPGGLKGGECVLSGPRGSSVGATCNVLMAAVTARGTTILRGAACEPHVDDLVHYLNAMGANIEGAGTGVLTVHGVRSLSGATYAVIPDQIEAGTFLVGAAMTHGDVTALRCRPDHMKAELDKLAEMGLDIEVSADRIRARMTRERLRPAVVRTAPYPAFPTDLQAQVMAALCLAEGESTVIETVHPERFIHASELGRMGADISIADATATVRGVARLSGATVMASDLRASAALLLAGAAAEGVTECLRVYHIDRGYERIEEKLRALGACIERISPPPAA